MNYRKPRGRPHAKRATEAEPSLPLRTRAIPPDPRDDIWTDSNSRSRKMKKNKKLRRKARAIKSRENPLVHWSAFPPAFLTPYVPQYDVPGYYAKNNGRAKKNGRPFDEMRDLYTPETFPYGSKASANPNPRKDWSKTGNKELARLVEAGGRASAAAKKELQRRAQAGGKRAAAVLAGLPRSRKR